MSSKDSGILGTIVTWQVPTSVSFETLKQGVKNAGLDEDMVKDLAPANALTRALSEMKKGRVIRKLRREEQKIYFQLTKEFLSEMEATYQKETELAIDADTGVLFCDDSEIKAQAKRLLEEHQDKRLASDVASLMFRVYRRYDGDLIPIREQGGVYFVPESHTALVNQTRALFRTIGGVLNTFDVRLGSSETAESVATSMAEYFQRLVQQFQQSCENVDLTRPSVNEARVAKIAEMRKKVELWRGLLRGYADNIDDVIDKANQNLMKQVAAAHAEKEKA